MAVGGHNRAQNWCGAGALGPLRVPLVAGDCNQIATNSQCQSALGRRYSASSFTLQSAQTLEMNLGDSATATEPCHFCGTSEGGFISRGSLLGSGTTRRFYIVSFNRKGRSPQMRICLLSEKSNHGSGCDHHLPFGSKSQDSRLLYARVKVWESECPGKQDESDIQQTRRNSSPLQKN